MAKSEAWADRSGDGRRRTLGRFAIVYGVIAVVALGLGWYPVGIIFALGAIGLGVARSRIVPSPADEPEERAKPDWMLAMDDPDAPDLSLPEYRTGPRERDAQSGPTTDRSPFDRPDTTGTPTEFSDPTEAPPSEADR